MDYKEFIATQIIPKYGPQPIRFRDWNKMALREFYIYFIKNRLQNSNKSSQLENFVREIEERISYSE